MKPAPLHLVLAPLHLGSSGPILARMPREPEPIRWTIFKLASKQAWVGEVEASDEREAIEKAAKE